MNDNINLLQKYMAEFSDAVENYHYANARLSELYGKMLDARKNLETYVKEFTKNEAN
jgi:hypothetical protein